MTFTTACACVCGCAHLRFQPRPVDVGHHQAFAPLAQTAQVRRQQLNAAVMHRRRGKAAVAELRRAIAGRQHLLRRSIYPHSRPSRKQKRYGSALWCDNPFQSLSR